MKLKQWVLVTYHNGENVEVREDYYEALKAGVALGADWIDVDLIDGSRAKISLHSIRMISLKSWEAYEQNLEHLKYCRELWDTYFPDEEDDDEPWRR